MRFRANTILDRADELLEKDDYWDKRDDLVAKSSEMPPLPAPLPNAGHCQARRHIPPVYQIREHTSHITGWKEPWSAEQELEIYGGNFYKDGV